MPMLSCFKKFIIIFTFVFYCTNADASSMLGFDTQSKAAADIDIPQELEATITNLLNATTAESTLPDNNSIRQILRYIEDVIDPSKISPKKREYGTGAFYRSAINVPMKELLEYCYNPLIPGEALYPSSIRSSIHFPESQIIMENVKLWEKLDQISAQNKPIVYSGREFIEITPDTFSNCYYSYSTDSIYILTNIDSRNVLVSISKQTGKSNVGKVGAIIGNDNNWNYLYSDKVGSNISFARWTKTFMYNSAIVKFYYPSKYDASITNIAFFKYLDAGWSNLNLIQKKHIYSGSLRSINSLKEIMQSPLRPSVAELISKSIELSKLNKNELLDKLQPYSTKLALLGTKSPKKINKIFTEILINQNYVNNLKNEYLRSELIKQFMKNSLQKTSILPAI